MRTWANTTRRKDPPKRRIRSPRAAARGAPPRLSRQSFPQRKHGADDHADQQVGDGAQRLAPDHLEVTGMPPQPFGDIEFHRLDVGGEIFLDYRRQPVTGLLQNFRHRPKQQGEIICAAANEGRSPEDHDR